MYYYQIKTQRHKNLISLRNAMYIKIFYFVFQKFFYFKILYLLTFRFCLRIHDSICGGEVSIHTYYNTPKILRLDYYLKCLFHIIGKAESSDKSAYFLYF